MMSNEDDRNDDGGLSKGQKGRLKKLSKRARTVQQNSESGICSSSQWQELIDLQEITPRGSGSFGPSVRWRSNNARGIVPGSDIRDILGRLMLTNEESTGKKRLRDEIDFVTKKLPKWVTLQNPAAVKHVGVMELHVESEESMNGLLDAIRKQIDEMGVHCVHSKVHWSDGSYPKSITDILLYGPRPKSAKPTRKDVKSVNDLFKLVAELTLRDHDLESYGYPVVLGISKDGRQTMANAEDEVPQLLDYDRTSSRASCENKGQGRIIGVDCEMVQTAFGSELARVTLVEVKAITKNGDVETSILWDQLVKPCNQVTDYRTEFSGVTASLLAETELTISDVHDFLRATLREEDILVGHSLENDLRALRWVHSRLVDTAILFQPSHRRHKFKLKTLAAQLLRRKIQCGASHCSAEDATAALELACKRAMYGRDFGIADQSPCSILHQISRSGTTVCLGSGNWLAKNVTSQPAGIHALNCERASDSSSKAMISWLVAPPNRRARLVYGRWSASESDELLLQIISNLVTKRDPANTLLLICIQPAFNHAQELQDKRRLLQNPKATIPWLEDDERAWKAAAQNCHLGCALWVGTQNI